MTSSTNTRPSFNINDYADGEHFLYNGIQFTRLREEQGGVLCITKNIWKDLPFNTNNPPGWRNSAIRRALYEEFLPKMNKDNLLPMTIDLTPISISSRLRGEEEYAKEIIGILSFDQYEKHKKIMPIYYQSIWTCSPNYVDPHYNQTIVNRHRDNSCYSFTRNYYGCAPVILFKKEEEPIFDAIFLFDV